MNYISDARVRARRRKSPWNLLLIPAVFIPWLTLWWLSALLVGQFARLVHPDLEFVLLPDTRGAILIALGLLFACLGPAMIIGDLLVALVPGARRTFETEAAPFPETQLKESIWGLLKFSAFLTPVGVLVAVVGAIIPW
jgi:hypothetical protein